jgi:hypothetical protein
MVALFLRGLAKMCDDCVSSSPNFGEPILCHRVFLQNNSRQWRLVFEASTSPARRGDPVELKPVEIGIVRLDELRLCDC